MIHLSALFGVHNQIDSMYFCSFACLSHPIRMKTANPTFQQGREEEIVIYYRRIIESGHSKKNMTKQKVHGYYGIK